MHEAQRQALGNGTERFVAYLLHACEDPTRPFEATLAATKRAIASQLHLTPERLSRILQELQQAQLLQVKGRKITVPDPARLKGSAGRP